MTELIRILATGIYSGDRLLRLAATTEMPFHAEVYDHDREVYRLAREQGAVWFEIDANYDADYHEPEETVEVLGIEITYNEYWEIFPEHKVEPKPIPCWQTWMLLRTGAPFMQLRSPTLDQILIAEWDTRESDYFLALTSALQPPNHPGEEQNHTPNSVTDQPVTDQPLHLQPGKISPLFLEEGQETPVQVLGWQFGEEVTLQPFPASQFAPTAPCQRDWDWPWRNHPSLGPLYLNIYVQQTATALNHWFQERVLASGIEKFDHQFYEPQQAIAELENWFAERGITQVPTPEFYQHSQNLRFERQRQLKQGYQQTNDYAYVFQRYHAPTGWLTFTDGLIRLGRNYHEPDPDQQAIDAVLLAELLTGELGEISWDILDGDYVYFEATGYDLASLQQSLDPNSEPDHLRQGWAKSLVHHPVDASTARDWQEVAIQIAQYFQVGLPEGDAIAQLVDWLGNTPIRELPRQVEVKLPGCFYQTYAMDAGYTQISYANSRILWRWSFG